MTAIRIVEGKAAEKITVLQGSNQADTVMLVTELPWQEGLFGKIGTTLQEEEVTLENHLGRAAAIWTIGEDFTKEAGEFAFTLTLTGDERIYQATGMLFVEAVTAADPTETIALFSAEEEERMTVDGATRKVTVPEALSTIGVEKDNNAQRIYFLCPRYFDGHDLSACTRHYVNYLNLNEMGAEAGQYPIDDVTVEGENMTFSWLVSNHVTQKPGKVAFILCFKEVNEEGEVTWEWNTEYNDQLVVLQGLEPGDAIAEQYPDVLEQWLSKMENAAKGITFTPTLSEEGVLSWSNDGNLENPAPVDLKGPQGEKGEPGEKGEKGNPGDGIPSGGEEGQVLTKTAEGTAWKAPAAASGKRLIFHYEHNKNPEIHFTEIDWATGIGTCASPHGITEDTKIFLNMNENIYAGGHNINTTKYRVLPYEYTESEEMYAVPIDATHLQISDGDKAAIVVNTSLGANRSIDCTQFHFEYNVSGVDITTEPFNDRHLSLAIYGFHRKLGQRDLTMRYTSGNDPDYPFWYMTSYDSEHWRSLGNEPADGEYAYYMEAMNYSANPGYMAGNVLLRWGYARETTYVPYQDYYQLTDMSRQLWYPKPQYLNDYCVGIYSRMFTEFLNHTIIELWGEA